jgi:hypothetical protein
VEAKQLLEFIKPSDSNSEATKIAAEQNHLDRFLTRQQESDFVAYTEMRTPLVPHCM